MDFLVLTKTGGILGPFATVLGFIINYIYEGLELIGIPNMGLAIILFTLIVNLILLPMTIKQQKTTKMMSVMNPELQKIQAKYKGKRDDLSIRRMQAETAAVYQKYGTSPTGGCLYMFIQLPILFALYQVIYRVPAYVGAVNDLYMNIAAPISQVADGSTIVAGLIETLQLRVVGGVDFANTETIVDFLAALKSTDWTVLSAAFEKAPDVVRAISEFSPEIIEVNSLFGVLNMTDLPLTNGWWPGVLIPILAGVSQYVSMKLSTSSQPEQNAADNPMGNSMKTMNAIMPLFSVFFCFTFNIGIGIYWIASAVFRTIIMVFANKIIDKKGVDKIIEENREKAKKKAEKRGEKPSKFEEYAKMSTKNYEEAPKRRSIKEIANTSTMTDAEKKEVQSSKNGKSKDQTPAKKKDSDGKAGSIAAIAHMLDNSNKKN